MPSPADKLIESLSDVVSELPAPFVEAIATHLDGCQSREKNRLVDFAHTAAARAELGALLAAWAAVPNTPPSAVAVGLRSASRMRKHLGEEAGVELVWTGPSAPDHHWRRTEQVLLGLIDGAKSSIWLVTFAAYKVASLSEALARAAERGVTINFVAESAQESDGKLAIDAILAFDQGLRRQLQLYVWPAEKREKDEQGRSGVLHAKCAVADNNVALVSSANLTDHALNLNIEMGILLRGPMAGDIAAMLGRCVSDGTFVLAVHFRGFI